MNPWPRVLESFHSAFIDEVNTQLPDHQPELGLPSRTRGLTLPPNFQGSETFSAIFEVNFETRPLARTSSYVFLVLKQPKSSSHRAALQSLVNGVDVRAPRELELRSIAASARSPKFEEGFPGSALPKQGEPEFSFTVWMPIKILIEKNSLEIVLGLTG